MEVDLLANVDKDFMLIKEHEANDFYMKILPAGTLLKVQGISLEGSRAEVVLGVSPNMPKADLLTAYRNSQIRHATKNHEDKTKALKATIALWDNDPDGFKKEPKNMMDKVVYKYHKKNVLGDLYITGDISTGWGSDTYYTKEKYQEFLAAHTDELLKKEIAKISKKPFAKELNSLGISLRGDRVSNFLRLAGTEKQSIVKAAPFPFTIDADVFNEFLSNIGGEAEVDDEFIDQVKEDNANSTYKNKEWKEFISNLEKVKGSTIATEHEGTHHHDGQVCEYTVTWTLADGSEYEAYDSHSLMNGWSFDGTVEFE